MTRKKILVDLTPISTFKYDQIYNHGFSFLLLNSENKALHSPCECKDYLQDMFWCENTGNSGEVYGIQWGPGMLDINVKTFRLALMGGTEKDMTKRLAGTLKFLNIFCKAQKFPLCKGYETQSPDMIVIEFSKDWTQNGPLLSAFTSLIRLAGAYTEGDALDYLKGLLAEAKKRNPPPVRYMSPDMYRLGYIIAKLAGLLAGMEVQHNWVDSKNIDYAHETGIVGFANFPTASLETTSKGDLK